MDILKETSDLFVDVSKKISSKGKISNDDAILIQRLLGRFRVLLDLSQELEISMLEDITQTRMRELKSLISKYQYEL